MTRDESTVTRQEMVERGWTTEADVVAGVGLDPTRYRLETDAVMDCARIVRRGRAA